MFAKQARAYFDFDLIIVIGITQLKHRANLKIIHKPIGPISHNVVYHVYSVSTGYVCT